MLRRFPVPARKEGYGYLCPALTQSSVTKTSASSADGGDSCPTTVCIDACQTVGVAGDCGVVSHQALACLAGLIDDGDRTGRVAGVGAHETDVDQAIGQSRSIIGDVRVRLGQPLKEGHRL